VFVLQQFYQRFEHPPTSTVPSLRAFKFFRFFSNLVGEEGPRIQGAKGLFSKDFISAFNILSISAMSLFSVPNSPFSIKSKSPANNICEVRLYIFSFGNFADIVYISKQSLYDFCQTFKSL
jgi:hypothetical protein